MFNEGTLLSITIFIVFLILAWVSVQFLIHTPIGW